MLAGFNQHIFAYKPDIGNGILFGLALLPAGFQPWIVMILPSGGFFTLALWLLLFNHLKSRRPAGAGLAQEASP